MSTHDTLKPKIEESLSVRIEKPSSTKKYIICSWFQRFITLDDVPNQNNHRPVFIIVMSTLHVFMYFLTYINTSWKGEDFNVTLFNLCKFYIPCMRPTPYNIRTRIVNCHPSMTNQTCLYDDVLKHMCFSFTYPHQIWRMVTVNLYHINWLHLLSNLLIQIPQGIPLERKYGTVRIAIIYWLSDVGADLCSMMTNIEAPGVGASGALYGLMVFLIIDRLTTILKNPDRRLFVTIQLILLLSPHIFASIPLIVKYGVAHSAHFGSSLVGFLIGVRTFGCPWQWDNEHCVYGITCRRIAFVFLFLYYTIGFTYFFLIDAPIVDSILY